MITAKSISVKQWVLGAVTVLLIAILIVANVVISSFALIINRVFLGGTTGDMSEAGDVLENADKAVQSVAADSIVLLKNDDDFLPITDLKKVNLFGYGSTDNGLLLVGGGSGGTTILDKDVDGKDRIKIDLTDAFKAANIEYNTDVIEAYEAFSSVDCDWRSGGTTGANATESIVNPGASFYTDALMDGAKSFSNTAIVTLSRFGAENGGNGELKNIGSYSNGSYLRLTANEKAMLDKLQQKGFDVIVLLNVTNNMELGFLNDYPCIKACLHIGIPGQSGCAVIPDILTGKINPSGKMSDTLAYDYTQYNPVYFNATSVSSNLVYQENIYFGYRWYETADVAGYFNSVSNNYGTGYDGVVQFPFGYGLSYSDFKWSVKNRSWSDGEALKAGEEYSITVTVHNEGPYDGKDVVQLYAEPPYETNLEKSAINLIAFAKTPTIQAGKSEDVTLTFTAYDLASYDVTANDGKGCYVAESGTYNIRLMDDAHNAAIMTGSGNSGKSSTTLKANADLLFTEDPDNEGATVENRFTGSNAYAGVPIDGSTAYDGGVNYLSRKNNFQNMITTARGASTKNNGTGIRDYRYGGYNTAEITAEVAAYRYGENATNEDRLVLTYVAHKEMQTNDNGEEVEVTVIDGIPTLDQLKGVSGALPEGSELVLNEELIEKLSDYDAPEWDELLDQLSQDEIKDLIGQGGFQTFAIESIGKPLNTDKDGPAGFNNNVTNGGKSNQFTIWPSESLTGCSWSTEAAALVGEHQGKIASSLGINGWYGPGVNLHRSVYNSRNYEYYSEDPVLSGYLAAATIKAAKENNLYCYLKHFAASEAGQNPTTWKTWLTEQSLRELYLKAFEIALKKSGGNGVMSAFNCIGAVEAGYNHALLTDILRGEWGFKGSVITDWYQGNDYMGNQEVGILGGNDLWLCGNGSWRASIDLNKTEVAFAARRSVKNILYTYVVTAGVVKVIEEPTSPAFVAVWVVLNVVLVAGMAVCVLFIVLDGVKRGKKAKAAETTEEESAEAEKTE